MPIRTAFGECGFMLLGIWLSMWSLLMQFALFKALSVFVCAFKRSVFFCFRFLGVICG